MIITLYNKQGVVADIMPTFSTFPGGEEHITIGEFPYPNISLIVVDYPLQSSADVMRLLLIKDALDYIYTGVNVVLKLGYMPYARQDRHCNYGEALSVKVMANLINSANFSEVVVADPHSDVTTALLDRVLVREQGNLLTNDYELRKAIMDGDMVMVAPDAGATKKVAALADQLQVGFVQAVKRRDSKTGRLSGFNIVDWGDVSLDKKFLIVDDICDGGGTFIGLAKELQEYKVVDISLYVTHGIFSRGTQVLIDAGIKHIYTTNTLPQDMSDENLTVIPWS